MADWQVVLKNASGADILIGDMGLTILNGGTEEITLQAGYSEIADSEDLKNLVTAGTLTVNDGAADLDVTNGLAHIRRSSKKYVDDQISNIDVSAATDPIQAELDAAEAGAGLETDGTYSADATTNYIGAASSLKDADKKLDAQVKGNADNITQNASDISAVGNSASNIQAELDTTQQGAGLGADGNYSANAGSNYIGGSTSLKDADNDLDAAIKANADAIAALGTGSITDLQNEVDAIEIGAGLGADGTYSADGTTNYLAAASSLKDADKKLDAQAKANADGISANATSIGANATAIAQNATDIGSNTTAIAQNATAITNEATTRGNADTLIQAELDAAEAGAGLETDGTYLPNAATNYLGASASLKAADEALDAQAKINADTIAQEVIDRTSEDALKVSKAGDTMSGNLDMGANKVTSSSAPVSGNDLVNKTYADTVASGFAPKAPVVVASTGNLALTGEQTIDGVAVVSGDRVLVKDQTDPIENGVYDIAAGAWVRSTDFDGSPLSEVQAGSRFYVKQGTAGAGAAFTLLGAVGEQFAPDTDPIMFGQTAGESSTANIQDELDTVEGAVGLNTDGTYSAHSGSNYVDGANTTKEAVSLLDTQAKANADGVSSNSGNIAQNTSDIQGLDTRTTALEDKTGNFGVINGIVVGKDTVRSKWLGYRESLIFGVKGKAKNRYLHCGGVPSNLAGPPVSENMTVTSLAVQLKAVAGADATINILKNASPVVLGSLVITSGNASANVNTLNIDLAAGDFIQLQVSSTQAVHSPVANLVAAYNGGSL